MTRLENMKNGAKKAFYEIEEVFAEGCPPAGQIYGAIGSFAAGVAGYGSAFGNASIATSAALTIISVICTVCGKRKERREDKKNAAYFYTDKGKQSYKFPYSKKNPKKGKKDKTDNFSYNDSGLWKDYGYREIKEKTDIPRFDSLKVYDNE